MKIATEPRDAPEDYDQCPGCNRRFGRGVKRCECEMCSNEFCASCFGQDDLCKSCEESAKIKDEISAESENRVKHLFFTLDDEPETPRFRQL